MISHSQRNYIYNIIYKNNNKTNIYKKYQNLKFNLK